MFQLTSLQWKSFFRSAALAGNLFSKIMTWFWIGTVIPLLSLFLLSFTQGDVSFYENWADQVGDKGLDAEAAVYDEERVAAGFKGILGVSVGLVAAAFVLLKLLDRKWGRAEFNN